MKTASLQDGHTVSIEDGDVELGLEMRKVRTVDKVCLIAEPTVGHSVFFFFFEIIILPFHTL